MPDGAAPSRPADPRGAILIDRDDREWVLPLAIGLLIGAAILVAGVAHFNRSVAHDAVGAGRETAKASGDTQKTPLSPPDSRVGRGELSTPTIAWISHSHWRELQAKRSPAHQPALQQEVDPVEDAPAQPDATPPSPERPAQPEASSNPPSPRATPPAAAAPTSTRTEAELSPPTPPQPATAAPPPAGIPREQDEGPLPEGSLTNTQPARRTPLPPRQEQSPKVDPQQAQPQQNDSPPETSPASGRPAEARPTSAPQAEESVPPTDPEEEPVEVRPGRVLTGPGVEITTARPEISVTARYMALGVTRNPVAILTFDHEGKVTDVALHNRTGLENIDAPLRASLYMWRATGEEVDAMREGQTFQKRFQILLLQRD